MIAQNPITERALVLLAALQAANGAWVSRAELARATGKRRLSPHDVLLLERLAESGKVEIRQRENHTPVGIAYDYRATDES